MWRINRILILLFSPFCAFPFNLDFSFTAKHFTEINSYIYYLPSFHGIMIWTNFKLHYMGMLPHTWFLRRFLQIFKLYMFLNECKIWQPHWIMIWTNLSLHYLRMNHFWFQLFWPNSFWKDFKDYTFNSYEKNWPPSPIVAPTNPGDHDLNKHEPTIDEEDNFSVQMVFKIRDFPHVFLCKIWPLHSLWLHLTSRDIDLNKLDIKLPENASMHICINL